MILWISNLSWAILPESAGPSWGSFMLLQQLLEELNLPDY